MGEVDGSHWHPQSPVISLNISKYSQADVVGLYTTWYWTWNSKAYRPKLCNMVVIYKALCGQLQITSSYFKRSISECTYKTALIYTLTSLKKTSTEQHEYSLQEIPGRAEQVKWHHKEAIKQSHNMRQLQDKCPYLSDNSMELSKKKKKKKDLTKQTRHDRPNSKM